MQGDKATEGEHSSARQVYKQVHNLTSLSTINIYEQEGH